MAAAPPSVKTEQPASVRWLVFALACSLSFVLYLHRYTWGFIKPDLQQEFGWDLVDLGWLDSMFLFSYGAGQIPSGMLCDWFGARALLGTSTFAWSLALAATALAGGLWQMAAARLSFGLAQAGCYPVLSKVSKNWFPLSVRSTAQGVIATFCGRLGGACSYLLFGTVLLGWLNIPWRWALAAFTLLGLACAATFVILFRNSPSEHPWSNEAEAQLVKAADPASAVATRTRLRWSALVANRSVWFLYLRAFASNLADVVYVNWIPQFLIDVKGVDRSAAGWMSALPLIGGALAGLASGWLQSCLLLATGSRRWARSSVGLAGKGLAAALVLSCAAIDDVYMLAFVLLLVKFFCDWEQPAEWGTITDLGGRSGATFFATVNTVGCVAGVVAGPLIGWVLKSYSANGKPTLTGWNVLFAIISAIYLFAALCWLLIDCTKEIEPTRPDPTPGKAP